MSTIIFYIVIAIFGLFISPFMVAIIKRFSNEEKIFDKNLKSDMKFDAKIWLMTPVVLIILFWIFGISEKFFVYAFLSIILIMDAFIDIKSQIIPNGLNMAGFLVGLVYIYIKLITNVVEGVELLLGMFIGAGIFLLIALFALIAYKKEGMGLGDVKLMGMLGMFFGARNIFQIFIFSFAVGAVVSIFLLITRIKKVDDYIPFGPFIVVASFITMVLPYTVVLPFIEAMV